MKTDELEIWWSSLSVEHKERIARKAMTKASPEGKVDEALIVYPACTRWWISLDEDLKKKIHDHCARHHGYLLNEWNDATPYGD